LRDYELVMVISPEVADEAVPSTVERVQQFIAEQGGQVKEVTPWGRRRLAYAIDRHKEGSYVLAQLSLDPQRLRALESNLELADDVIRHIVVRLEEAESPKGGGDGGPE
jgi:small subunit ribosomal protein S6